MKNTTHLLILLLIVFSCGETGKKIEKSDSVSDVKLAEISKNIETRSNRNNTPLCKINGELWEYTTGDGLVSRNSSTNVRTATIGFRKQLDKGYESIQVEYDVDKNILNSVLVELKRPNKDGNIVTTFYTEFRKDLDANPEAKLSGTISLSEEARKASGNAECVLINEDKNGLEFSQDYRMIKITDLNFSGVSYSDTDDLKKLMNK